MEIQRIIQSEKTWSDMASIEGTEEMTEEQIDAMMDDLIDAAMMTEKKDLTKTLNYKTGVEERYFSHTRVIGDRSYSAKQSITDGKEKIETKMDDFELQNFKNEWKEKWNPTISQPKIDRIIQFEQQWSIIETAEEMTEEKIDAMVDGALMTEKKVLTKRLWDGDYDIDLSHTRVIEDRRYTAKKSKFDGEKMGQELIKTKMNIWPYTYRQALPAYGPMDVSEQEKFKDEWEEKRNPIIREEENFKNEWEENWNPTIREEPGIFARFVSLFQQYMFDEINFL